MKKILIVTNVLTLSLLFIAWKNKTPESGIPDRPQPCCTYNDMLGEKLSDFKLVVKRYKEFALPAINARVNEVWLDRGAETPNFKDTRCIWFSMDSIKQFICTIERYSAKLNLQTSNLGIRMYYGQYDISHPHYPDQHTIFMMPTFSLSKTGPAIDFDPRYNVQKGWGVPPSGPKGIKSFAGGLVIVSPPFGYRFTILSAAPYNPAIRNSGELCPPNCVPAPDNTFDLTDH